MHCFCVSCVFFFFIDPAPPEIYTLSLHDALPISFCGGEPRLHRAAKSRPDALGLRESPPPRAAGRRISCFGGARSEEHTSELQSPVHLVCRLLLEKKKMTTSNMSIYTDVTNCVAT